MRTATALLAVSTSLAAMVAVIALVAALSGS